MRRYYEVLYYPCERGFEKNPLEYGDPIFRKFSSKKKALEYYENHKNDPCKCLWWVTYRDEYGDVIDDIIY